MVVSKIMRKKNDEEAPRSRKKRETRHHTLHTQGFTQPRVASHFDVPVVFSAPGKLSGLCHKINNKKDKGDMCKKKCSKQFVDSAYSVVYEIPMICGKAYLGQTGRCVNDWAREHALSVRNPPPG